MKKYFSPYSFSVLVGVVAVAFLTAWYAFAFDPPAATPPGCPPGTAGCDAPINISGSPQTKEGDLTIANGGGTAVLQTDLFDSVGAATFGSSIFVEGGSGDVDGNGFININDVTRLVDYFGSGPLLTTDEYMRADVDGDGRVTYDDLGMINTPELFGKDPALIPQSDYRAAERKFHGAYGMVADGQFVIDGSLSVQTFVNQGGVLTVTGDTTGPVGGVCPAGFDFYDENNNGVVNPGECKVTSLIARPDGAVGVGVTHPESRLQIKHGYIQIDLTAGAPPVADCDAAVERGRMVVDSVINRLYVCVDTWRKTDLVLP